MTDYCNSGESSEHKGLAIDFVDPAGVVLLSVADFDQSCVDSAPLEVSQRLRARTALRRAAANAFCKDFFAGALSGIHVEMAMDRLIAQGFRREERIVDEPLPDVERQAASLDAETQQMRDKIDGLESELDAALDVLWRRGDAEAREWLKLNYPAFYEQRAAAVAVLHSQIQACDWPTAETVGRLSFEEEHKTAIAALDAATMAIIGLAQDDVSNETAHRILQAIDFLPYARLVIDAAKAMRERLALVESFRLARDVAVVKRGDDKWVVFNGCSVLNRDDEWEYEPLPSSREEDFIARTRFSLEEAFRLGEVEAEKVRAQEAQWLAKRGARP